MDSGLPQRKKTPWISILLTALLLTVGAVSFASPENTGDATDYARDAAASPSPLAPSMLESGHLLWRPLGVMLRNAAGRPPSGTPAAVIATQRSLTHVSVVATFVAATFIGWLVLGVSGSLAAGLLATVLTVLGNAVLNFGQAGAPYVTSLALLAAALWVGVLGGRVPSLSRGLLVGAVLAFSVLFWLPFVFVVPAALLSVYVLAWGEQTSRRMMAIAATTSCALTGIGAYLGAAALHGIASPDAFRHWMTSASHGISRPGLTRVALGLPRSFVHMGVDGREVKRYLVGDQLNPVAMSELLRLHLWPKLLLIYAAIGVVALFASRRRQGRTLLLLLLVAALPVIAFGAAWSGGEEERYLALYPFVFLVVGWALTQAGAQRNRVVTGAIIVLSALFLLNLFAYNPWITRERSVAVARRLGCVSPMLDANTTILLPHQADPLVTFSRDRLDERPRNSGTAVVYLLPPMAMPGKTWEEILSRVITSSRATGGRVWVPAYALDSVPPREMAWVEGAQPEHWSGMRAAFTALNPTRTCAETGFLEVVAP